uniref:Uncharacterized protein n=1 Tax=Lactuca sativa TaxID=4236 RepID=A0A9R1UXI0_LACSA|nr:hypothetical protein LSAT_V11C700380530 [Lactuca sativa]
MRVFIGRVESLEEPAMVRSSETMEESVMRRERKGGVEGLLIPYLDEMKLISRENKDEEYAFFLKKFIPGYLPPHHGRYVVSDKNGKGGSFHAKIWYLFFDCLNVDLIH